MVQLIPHSQLIDALDRAVFLRRLAADGMSDGQVIFGVAVPAPVRLDATGWANAGVINDPFSGPGTLVVWWNPQTDDIRVDYPKTYITPKPDPFLNAPPRPPSLQTVDMAPMDETPARIAS